MTRKKIAVAIAILALVPLSALLIRHKPQPRHSPQIIKQRHLVQDVAGVPEKQPYHFTPQQSKSFSDRLNFGKLVGLALRVIAKQNNGQLPPDLTPATAWLATNSMQIHGQVPPNSSIGADSFELVYKGNLSDLTNPAQTILAREKDPVEIHEGRWNRMYIFADGSVNRLEATTADGFPAREKEVWPNQPP